MPVVRSRRRLSPRALLLAGTALLALLAAGTQAQPAGAATPTVVSIEFDDGNASQSVARQMLADRGIKATYFLNSGRLGTSGYLTRQQALDLQSDGHEIAGHTLNHVHLTQVSDGEARRQICDDRQALIAQGFNVANFAYPFGDHNAAVEQIVKDCQYDSARLISGLKSPAGCSSCPYAEKIPPPDRWATRTAPSVRSTFSASYVTDEITNARNAGGGWVQIVFHHICSGCDTYSMTQANFAKVLDFVKQQSDAGAIQVRTVRQVVTDANNPPPPTPVGLQNPSLESDVNGDGFPDCWRKGDVGVATVAYARTNDAHTGSWAERMTVTNLQGDANRKVVSMQDLGPCAPAAVPGHRYQVTAWYKSPDASPRLVVYYRDSAGKWQHLGQGADQPKSTVWRPAAYTSPVIPAGASAISIGMLLHSNGTLTMDDFALADAGVG
jgi:peptidoglycan/xylan/chitin deacetylase (PgdA/CDA1 family)